MAVELSIRLKQAFRPAAAWTDTNPVLLAGEWGIESDTKRRKLGDGTTAWNELDYDSELGAALKALDVLTPAADRLPYFTGPTTAATTGLTDFGRSLLDDASALEGRGTLGLGTMATQNAGAVAITGGSVNGLTALAIGAGNDLDKFNLLEAIGMGVENGNPNTAYIGMGAYWNGTVLRCIGSSAYGIAIRGSRTGALATTKVTFSYRDPGGGGTDFATFTADGRLGIGSTSPSYPLHVAGALGFSPGSAVTPANNGDVVFELTSNTTLTIKAKGADGTIRTATLTLA